MPLTVLVGRERRIAISHTGVVDPVVFEAGGSNLALHEPVRYVYAPLEQGSEDRLKKAAIELFDEQGFDNTSVIEIAERARVTTRTFFGYFPDKQEVLFAERTTCAQCWSRKCSRRPTLFSRSR